MKTFEVFCRIWLSIVFIFTPLFSFFGKENNEGVEYIFGHFIFTFLFSIPPAIVLLIVLLVSKFIIKNTLLLPRFVFLYFMAAISVLGYSVIFEKMELTLIMAIAVFSALLIHTNALITMWVIKSENVNADKE